MRGEAHVLRDGIGGGGNVGRGPRTLSVSRTGVLAIRTDRTSATAMTWFDRSGREAESLALRQHCRNPELSPEQHRVALECYEQDSTNRDVWLYDLIRSTATRLTNNSADDADPVWSPDGEVIAFSSNRRGDPDVYRMTRGSIGSEQLLLSSPGPTNVMSWSPGGGHIAVMGRQDLMIVALGDPSTIQPVVATPFSELEPQFSPDGRYFMYSSDDSADVKSTCSPGHHRNPDADGRSATMAGPTHVGGRTVARTSTSIPFAS